MDNVTHALAGLLLADATTSWVARRSNVPVPNRFASAAAVLGVIAAEFPDSDLVYSGSVLGMGKLGYLMHHRGHTHTIVWAVLSALFLWYVTCWLLRRRSSDSEHVWLRDHGRWPLLALALIGTLSHIVLDWTNSYGVHPFWPLDNRWYYGDAVFIVEPWLWVIGIPAVIFSRHTRWAKAVLGVLLLLILAASWGLGQVARPVAVLISAFVVVWLSLQWRLTPKWRAVSGIGVWAAATVTFFTASARAKVLVRESARLSANLSAGAEAPLRTSVFSVRDVVLNPAPGDPTCWAALAITSDGAVYRLASAQVAPFGELASCRSRYPQSHRVGGDALAALPDATPVVPFGSTPHVQWRTSWARPMSELVGLANERCEFAVSLRFMRAPVWQRNTNGTVMLSDVRFGVGGGFAEMEIPFSPTRDCSLRNAWVPGWTPPVL
ncbi:MAG: metal-dependent hydrolase [Gemmatimonadaceae bacterium]|nr:metal-dependent hydrolase [Gemmatimonadaceae bacterium]